MFGFSPSPRPLGLALQGGGAHGAFTWGVLDLLLERTAHPIAAISGTSAGAVNAVVLAHGLLEGGRAGARAALARFWRAVGDSVPWQALGLVAADGMQLTTAGSWMLQWSQALSPAQSNPMGYEPLRALLAQQIDYERLRSAAAPRLFIAATHANSGRLRVFGNADLDVDATVASACLPTMQSAVSIDGEPYWDGGFSANPAVFPLLHEARCDDVLLVLLAPWTFGDTPTTSQAIRVRSAEIAFNNTLLREMRAIVEHSAAARDVLWPSRFERRLRRTRWHLVDSHDDLADLPAHSKVIAHPQLIERLFEAGRQRMASWLDAHGTAIGRRGSADIARWFGGHLAPATNA